MSKFFVKVNKQQYRPGDHIEFLVFSDEGKEIAGAWHPHAFVEHHVKLAYLDKKKTGYGNVIEMTETEHVKFFELGENYSVGFLSELAENIQVQHKTYSEQYAALLTKLSELGIEEAKK